MAISSKETDVSEDAVCFEGTGIKEEKNSMFSIAASLRKCRVFINFRINYCCLIL